MSCIGNLKVVLKPSHADCQLLNDLRQPIQMCLQFYDAGNEGGVSGEAAEAGTDKPLDLSDAIANEVAELKERSNAIFTFHKTHVNGLLFISMAASAGQHML